MGCSPDLHRWDGAFDAQRWGVEHARPFVASVTAVSGSVSRAVPHVSNIEFVRWLDRAAELHADSVGDTRARLLERGLMWFVARHEIDYLAEAWPGDELLVATWVLDVQPVRSWRAFRIVRPSDGTVICQARTLWVLVNLETRRPARIDGDMARRYDALMEGGSTDAEGAAAGRAGQGGN
jgi:acyl-CoA thioester hydrolase